MTQFDEELSRRAEELRRVAADVSKDFRKLATDVRDQMEVFAEDLRRRARGSSPFEQSAIERIRALAGLRDEGIISEEEFQEQKRRLLDQV
ncbi:MAG: SHOCT domain-containing protein [Thermoleophilia bacterium]